MSHCYITDNHHHPRNKPTACHQPLSLPATTPFIAQSASGGFCPHTIGLTTVNNPTSNMGTNNIQCRLCPGIFIFILIYSITDLLFFSGLASLTRNVRQRLLSNHTTSSLRLQLDTGVFQPHHHPLHPSLAQNMRQRGGLTCHHQPLPHSKLVMSTGHLRVNFG